MARATIDHQVRVRFAPSPTGALHLGSAMVALANVAFARANGGEFVLRIDDTDQSRSRDDDTFELLRLLRWLELDWDEGPVHQRPRAALYRAALEWLEVEGRAYPCFCGVARIQELHEQQRLAGLPPRYDGRCRELDPADVASSLEDGAPHVMRFATDPTRDVEFDDLVRGRVVVPAGAFGDPILCRSDGSAGYLLASVVDDIELGITHVIRGEDHLSNTARQLVLFEALRSEDPGPIPRFAHVPLLRDVEGGKLSKRDPLGTLDELVDEGFLPVTVRRYLAELLGQGAVDPLDAGGSGEARFSLAQVPTGAPRVDRARLESLGREDMARLDDDGLLAGMLVDATEERMPVVRELAANAPSRVALRGELRLVFDGPGPGDLQHVLAIAAPDDEARATADAAWELVVERLRELQALDPDTGADATWAAPWLQRTRELGGERGLAPREVLRPLRVALTGTTGGPALDLVLTAIGAPEALRRVHVARAVLDEVRGGNDGVRG